RIDIVTGVSASALKFADEHGTVVDSDLVCPNFDCKRSTPITMIRGDRKAENGAEYGLRMWDNSDVVPRPGDGFQERLYCIRWVDRWIDDEGKEQVERYFRAPDEHDLGRETCVLNLLMERFADWQARGYVPRRSIKPGDETTRLLRERGWTHWHHLF